MKLFCVICVFMMTAAILIVDVLVCHWLAANGPEWILKGFESQPKGAAVAICGLIVAVTTIICMFVILANIDKPTTPKD